MSDKTPEQRISDLESQVNQIVKSEIALADSNRFLVKQNAEQAGLMVATKNDQAALLKLLGESAFICDEHRQEFRDIIARIESTGERMELVIAKLNERLNPPPPLPGS